MNYEMFELKLRLAKAEEDIKTITIALKLQNEINQKNKKVVDFVHDKYGEEFSEWLSNDLYWDAVTKARDAKLDKTK